MAQSGQVINGLKEEIDRLGISGWFKVGQAGDVRILSNPSPTKIDIDVTISTDDGVDIRLRMVQPLWDPGGYNLAPVPAVGVV